MLPWPSRPPRGLSGRKRHAPEVAAVDVGDAVVLRQPLVDERVVGREQIERRCGSRAGCCRGTARSRAASRRAASRRSRGTDEVVGLLRVDVAQEQPLLGEVRDQRSRSRVGQHPAHLRVRAPPARAAVPATATFEQLVVGNAAPEEERQARRQLEVADADTTVAGGAGRLALDAEQELRADQQPLERALDAGVEAGFGAALVIERQQVLDVGLCRRPPIGAPRQRQAGSSSRSPSSCVGARRRCDGGSASRPAPSRRTAR